jgi:heat shock protein HslJ
MSCVVRKSGVVLGILGAVALLCAGCGPRAPAETPVLAPSSWRFVEFQSMDDAIGTTRPEDTSLYTMTLRDDGTVSMQLNCNRANGTWTAEPAAGGASGSFTFGPLAMTRAFCPPPSLDQSIATQLGFVRSFLLRDGRLHLSLMADGGILVFEPDTATP